MQGAMKRPWIISPMADLLFIIGAPVLIALVFAPAILLGHAMGLAVFVMFVVATAHHVPGFLRILTDPELFFRFPWRFLVIPPAVIAASIWFQLNGLHGVTLIALVWGIWHGMMQVYGFARIYDAKVGAVSPLSARLDWLLCLSWFATLALWSPYESNEFQLRTANSGVGFLFAAILTPATLTALALVTAVLTVVYVVYNGWALLWRRQSSPLKLLLLAVALPLLWVSYRGLAGELLVSLAIWELYHDIQYFAIVWSYNQQRGERNALNRLGHFLFRPSLWLIGIYVLISLGYGGLDKVTRDVEGSRVAEVIQATLVASALLHFYFDGFIWKIRQKQVRQDLQIEDFAASNHQVGSAPLPNHRSFGSSPYGMADCLAQLALLGIPIAALAATEIHRSTIETPLFQIVVSLRPNSADAHYQLARLYDRDGRWREAADEYRRSLELNPSSAKACSNLGIALAKQGDYPEAVRWMRRSIEIDATFVDAYLNLSMLQWELRQYKESLDLLETAVQSVVDEPSLVAALATQLSTCPQPELLDVERAIHLAEDACGRASDKRLPEILVALATAYAKADRLPEAIDTLERALEISRQEGQRSREYSMEQQLQHYRRVLAERATASVVK